MSKIYIIGNGNHAKEVATYIQENNSFDIEGYIVDDEYYNSSKHNTISLSNFIKIFKGSNVKLIAALASNRRKNIIDQLETLGFQFISIIHNTTYVNNTASINDGVCIAPQCTVNVNVQIGKHSIINSNCNLSHDCVLEDFVTLSPSVTLTGNVKIKEGAFIGAGATILPNITIGKNAVIGAGASVINDIPDNCTAVGVPAKIIKNSFES